jgi:hypothetical protein
MPYGARSPWDTDAIQAVSLGNSPNGPICLDDSPESLALRPAWNSRLRGVASVAMATGRMGGVGPRQDRAGLAREVNAAILALEARLDDESFLARDPA